MIASILRRWRSGRCVDLLPRAWRDDDFTQQLRMTMRTHITLGSGMLRWISTPGGGALLACRQGLYPRLKQQKPAPVSRIALVRKFLIAVWAWLRNGVCFDEAVFARQDERPGKRQNNPGKRKL